MTLSEGSCGHGTMVEITTEYLAEVESLRILRPTQSHDASVAARWGVSRRRHKHLVPTGKSPTTVVGYFVHILASPSRLAKSAFPQERQHGRTSSPNPYRPVQIVLRP